MDKETIYNFSESDFEIILQRVEYFGIGVYSIESWLNGKTYAVAVHEKFKKKATNPLSELRSDRSSLRSIPSMYRGRTGTSAIHPLPHFASPKHPQCHAAAPNASIDSDRRQLPNSHAYTPAATGCHPRRHPAHAADPHAACCDACDACDSCDADCGMMCRAAVLSPICMEPSSYGCETMCGHAFCTL